MWRSLIRIAPLALAGFRWWQRRQQKKGRATPQQRQQQPPPAPGDRLP